MSNPPRGSRLQCNQGIPAAPLQPNDYGLGHGRYKQPYKSVLPYIQGEDRHHNSPYVTDGCIIVADSLYFRLERL